ncbi:MAG: IscS subfamily cysteine desulfurase [Chlamydiae bacterium]|nr:IscS subfamily cysteine desulfurase [Chlamydiota bacterium]MBI3266956.1 IscS subfamily cysteine desulfurase [Chlamydiota bacterium]
MKFPIYMDNHATTPLDARGFEEMLPCFKEDFGNAASRFHLLGWRAEEKVEKARARIASLIGSAENEIIFTSGATESNNLAIKGVAWKYRERGNHIITCVTEHKSVLDTCRVLEKQGFEVTYLPVDSKGLLNLDQVRSSIRGNTILISLMAANNEIGVLHPIGEIGKIAKHAGVIFHTDATQALAEIAIHVEEMGIDLMSFSAHKMYGPKGVGGLYVRRHNPRIKLMPLLDGGGHEYGLRSGTLNVPGIVGFGKACEIVCAERTEEAKRLLSLRERLRKGLMNGLTEVYVNGDLEKRLPNNLNMSFAYIEAESLLMGVRDEIALSSGAACMSALVEPSYVLKALGVPERLAHTSVRFSLGRFNTEEEVDYVIRRMVDEVRRLRDASPIYEMVKQETGPPVPPHPH